MAHTLDEHMCLHDLLQARAGEFPDRPAILAPHREPVTYRQLFEHVEGTVSALNDLGIGRNDRVAVVLPNGPEMALAFLSVASGMTCAPLNPNYQAAEFDFYLSDLGAKAVIVPPNCDSSVIEVARSKQIAVIDSLVRRSTFDVGCSTFAGGDDVALVLHTSGTTSRPKIVPLTQANLCISARNIADSLELTGDDRCLNVMPLFHIHGLLGALLSSLTAGGSVVCTPGFFATDFFDWMFEFGPTWYTAVPTMHAAILSRIPHSALRTPHCLRFIRSCSSALPPKLMADLEAEFGVPVIEAYGMTEASHQMACNPLPPRDRKPGSVGIAAGPEVAIMDEAGNLLTSGSTGEIVIRGPNVTPGYENNPQANESSFANSWFRTGDQGYLDQDGYLFITGRIKELINRAGEKISPREIDEALLNHPAIAQALAFAVPHPRLGEDLAAAVVLRENAAVTEREIREFMASRLADFKVPSRVVILDEIPKGPTGKPQRIGLAEKLGLTAPPEVEAVFVLPRTPIESELAAIWAEVLGVEQVGVLDSFFDLGGDSMLATRLISRIREEYHAELTLVGFFESPTIATQAEALENAARGVAIQRSSSDDCPLSFAQERVWFIDQLEPGGCAYNRPVHIRLTGELNVDALQSALNEIIRRHECLRASFDNVDGRPVQRISPDLALTLTPVDVPSERAALAIAVEEAHLPFDLSSCLIRAKLLRTAAREHLLFLTVQHTAFDHWSQSVLITELGALYEDFEAGRPSSLPELPIQYSDYACWQRGRLQGEVLEEQLSYWRQRLSGRLPILELPADHPRPPLQTFDGACHSLIISPSLVESLKDLARARSSTLFMVLLAAFKTLLYRHTGETDLLVGLPIAGRTRAEVEGLIGLFVNTLVMRTDLSGNPAFGDLLAQVRTNALGAFANQDLPFERLVEELQPERNLSGTPVYQVLFNFENIPAPGVRGTGISIAAEEFDVGIAQFDLAVEIGEKDGGLICRFKYNTDLFEPSTIERMANHYRNLLEGVALNPDQRVSDLPLLSEAERHQLLVEWNDTRADYPRDKCIHQLFEAQVERTPNLPAVIFEGRTLTYRELDCRANQLARHLQAFGVGPEVPVGIHIERSLDMMVGLLGILKAGGAYVPLDPTYPAERVAYMITQARMPVIITQRLPAESLPEHEATVVCLDSDWDAISRLSSESPATAVSPENLAYIIFTSGSTGRPKGVEINHRSAVNLVDFVMREIDVAEGDIVLAAGSLSFDLSVSEIFPPVTAGATMVVAGGETARDIASLHRLLVDSRAGILNTVPAVWRLLIESGWQGWDGMKILCGAEAMPRDLADQLLDRGKAVWNLYGPTEATVWSTTCRISRGKDSISIGKPIANYQAYILDEFLNPVPVGVPGELHISGDGLARGYCNRPDLTAENFISNPFEPNGRMYKTGDLARYLPDGNIEFLGRLDHQVKIRGFRIELGEIESVLSRHPSVSAAVTRVWDDASAGKYLAAYFVPTGDPPFATELREFLATALPDYMIPASFTAMDSLPLSPNGKVDRKALPPPETAGSAEVYVEPRTPLEQVLAMVWAEVLGTDRVGVNDDYFALGGHSLLATRLVAHSREILQIELPVRAIFEKPTVSQLAGHIEELNEDIGTVAEMILQVHSLSEDQAQSLLGASDA